VFLTATATAGHWSGWLILAGAAIVWAMVYAGSCWLWPFKPHRRCKGTGRIQRDDRKVHRLCRGCGSTGRKLRAGRWVWNYFADRRREARRGQV
jgi:hypothetical protein